MTKMMRIISWLKRFGKLDSDKPLGSAALGLTPLYAEKGRIEHEQYVSELEDALTNERIHNIALTGNYGSGKSSILADFENGKEARIIRISLSTLGGEAGFDTAPTDAEKSKNEKQANAIQKEIVKQLLFREEPDKVPNSKFKRISAPNLLRIFLISALAALIIEPFLYQLWGANLLDKFLTHGLWRFSIYVDAFVCIWLLVAIISLSLSGKFIINKLAGGPVTLSLSSKNNYFDEYLDELIYFFQATKYDIVILEDIERFEDTHIFVTLKQLNALLNGSRQIRAKGKSIRFIYAVKDSLFANGESSFVLQSANRAKFFDLIIPVVPFITHQSSKDIIVKMFNTEGSLGVSKEIIGIIAKYITDMRLIKNIYNEYLVFSKKILGRDSLGGLTKDRLFAMIVYKNTNLKDFEQIKQGDSRLDKIYARYRVDIRENISSLNREIAKNKAKHESPQSLASRSEEYGSRLVSFINIATSAVQARGITYTFRGTGYSVDQMSGAEFWDAISDIGSNETLDVNYTCPPYNNPQNMRLGRNQIEQIIAASLEVEKLEAADRELLEQRVRQLRQDLSDMSDKTLEQLMSMSPEFQKFIRTVLGDNDYLDLVYDLLASGKIDTNFVLYTSIFHGTNPTAANFLIHHLQPNKPDLYYKFDGEKNISALLSDSGNSYFRSKSIYNIEILDYLLRSPNPDLNIVHALYHITNNLAQGKPADLEFLDEYIRSGSYKERLIEILAGKWQGIFDYVVKRAVIDNALRPILFNAALIGCDKEIKYIADEGIPNYIAQDVLKLDILTKSTLDASNKEKLTSILKQFNLKLLSYEGLSDDAKDIIVENDLYAISLDNLRSAIGSEDLSLDNILGRRESVFNYVVSNLKDYFAILENSTTKYTITNRDLFKKIINHIAESDVPNLENVIAGASSICVVDDLAAVSSKAWSALVVNSLVEPSYSNIFMYFAQLESDEIDEAFGKFLSTRAHITHVQKEDSEDKKKLAIAILNTKYIGPDVKSRLLTDLRLSSHIPVNEFKLWNSKLYGYLVANDVIDDSAETYTLIMGTNIETRIFYIENSAKFAQYVSEISLQAEEIDAIAASEGADPEIKKYLINNIASLESELTSPAADKLAVFALANDMVLDSAALLALVDGPSPEVSIQLLNLSSTALNIQDISRILQKIGRNLKDGLEVF
jgi:hypothetical protein